MISSQQIAELAEKVARLTDEQFIEVLRRLAQEGIFVENGGSAA